MSRTATGHPTIEAGGAVVWRLGATLEVLLVHRPRYQDWSWPKGKVDPGEAVPSAAVREISEETGHDVVLGVPLPQLRYELVEGGTKRVHLWAARLAGPDDAPALAARVRPPAASPEEIDGVEWMSVADAELRLTRPSDAVPLAALVALHAKDRLATAALVVARHARAKRRSAWKGTEADRPLTPTGRGQADDLVPVLAAFGAGAISTSAWERCARTIEPYAQATGLTPRHAHLSEAAHERSPGRVAAEVLSILESGKDTVLCTHRPVLPTVLDVLGQHAGRSVAALLPGKEPFLRTGEILVAHVGQTAKGPRVLGVEVHRPLRS